MASLPICPPGSTVCSQNEVGVGFSGSYAFRRGNHPVLTRGGPWQARRQQQRSLQIVMRDEKNDGNTAGGDSAESLFMRELRRRGLASSSAPAADPKPSSSSPPTSASSGTAQDGARESARGSRLQGLEPPPITGDNSQPQIAKSRALASEGLDGLPVRAWELLKLGGSFSLGFAPLVLGFIAIFVAAYLYFGEGFVHPGSKYNPGSQPTYIDPYQLLEEEYYQQKALGL